MSKLSDSVRSRADNDARILVRQVGADENPATVSAVRAALESFYRQGYDRGFVSAGVYEL